MKLTPCIKIKINSFFVRKRNNQIYHRNFIFQKIWFTHVQLNQMWSISPTLYTRLFTHPQIYADLTDICCKLQRVKKVGVTFSCVLVKLVATLLVKLIMLYSVRWHICDLCQWNGEINPCCQFYQCRTGAFFVRKQIAQLSLLRFQLCNLSRQNFVRKTRVKC